MTRKGLVAAACVAASAVVVAPATAVAPAKGKTYKGTLTGGTFTNAYTLSFKVSASGKRLSKLTVSGTPFFCEGGGTIEAEHYPTVSVTSKGTFKAVTSKKITTGPSTGKPQYKATLTGRFVKGGKAKGRLKIDAFGSDKACDGHVGWSAKVA